MEVKNGTNARDDEFRLNDLQYDGNVNNMDDNGFNGDEAYTDAAGYESPSYYSKVITSIRVKPLIDSQSHKQTLYSCVSVRPDVQSLVVHRDHYDRRVFAGMDHVFGAHASNTYMYSHTRLKSIVRDVTHGGYNGCAIAYGQTGSGKTYTMFGSDKCPGLAFLTIQDVFAAVKEHERKFRVANVIISMFQVHIFLREDESPTNFVAYADLRRASIRLAWCVLE
jgi:hypothetical protein